MKPRMIDTVMKSTTAIALVAALGAAPAMAASDDVEQKLQRPDGSWISFTGTVAASFPDGFELDYGNDTVTVEVDDWDWYAESFNALPGDTVTVSGRVDKDGFETRKVEAGYLYVHDLHEYHFSNAADEEDAAYIPHGFGLEPDVTAMSVVGTVDDIRNDEFTLMTGYGEIVIETETMTYDPLDDVGYQQLDRGDRVSVSGILAPGSLDGFYDDRELVAARIVTLRDNGAGNEGA